MLVLVGSERYPGSGGVDPCRSDAAHAELGKARRGPFSAWPSAGRRAGAIALADTLKPHAREVVDALRRMGGRRVPADRRQRDDRPAIGEELGLARRGVFAGVLPDAKAAKIAELRRAKGGPARGDGRRRPERRPRAGRGRRRAWRSAREPTWPRRSPTW